MAGRVRQYMWESNRMSSEEKSSIHWSVFWFFILPLIIITKGQILFVLAGVCIPLFIFCFLFSS
jgi:hypothetical protein